MSYTLYKGDCLEEMKNISDGSVDMILCDLPYGTTACKWDAVIELDAMWKQYRRIIRPNRAIVLTAAQPFTTELASSNMRDFRYTMVWNKMIGTNFVQAKRMPMRIHEDVLVFSTGNRMPDYFPQMIKRDKPIKKGANGRSEAIPIARTDTNAKYEGKVYDEKYPETIMTFSNRGAGDRGLHPTQKPVALMEYLVRTYTNEGNTVLDNCMGSGTTGVACMSLGRQFIGIEQDDKYFDIAKSRIEQAFDGRLI